MAERNLLEGYPAPKEPRRVARNLRTIGHRLVAAERGPEFFDGDRNYGYGGFNYDGRWGPIAERFCSTYDLTEGGNVLQINCEKGFLLHDFLQVKQQINIAGTETSSYAIDHAMAEVRPHIRRALPMELPFEDGAFQLVIALGVVYAQTLSDAVRVLREIERVGQGRAFITLASYETAADYFLFKDWTLLGTLLLRPEEWCDVLEYAGYAGDYWFTSARSLNLIRAD